MVHAAGSEKEFAMSNVGYLEKKRIEHILKRFLAIDCAELSNCLKNASED